MAQEIYNEGRVVGFSAWEIFAKIKLDGGTPPEEIPNEREWLASMIGSGASMILNLRKNTPAGVYDFPLPEGSNLTAAGVILANPFIGDCDWEDYTTEEISYSWGKRVKEYGDHVILNDSDDEYPSADGSYVPYGNYSLNYWKRSCTEFLKVLDGIVYTKNAKWAPIGGDPAPLSPYEDIVDTNFNESRTVIRLYISSEISENINILFTGFANKRILDGFSEHAADEGDHTVGGSCDISRNNWKNGGMIGPEMIPWASKIIFSVPSLAYSANSLHRLIPSDQSYTAATIAGYQIKHIDSTMQTAPLIDFDSINLSDYYTQHSSTFYGPVTLSTTISNNGSNYNYIVAWYPGMTASNINDTKALSTDDEKRARFFPPAIYGQQITGNGNKTLVPLDVAAPGTVKCFKTEDEAINYKTLLPDNYAMLYVGSSGNYAFVDPALSSSEWPSTAKMEYVDELTVRLTVGDVTTKFISLTDPENNDYDIRGREGTDVIGPSRNLSWLTLTNALYQGHKVDVLGDWLRDIGTELTSNSSTTYLNKHTLGLRDVVEDGITTSWHIDYIGTRYFILNPGTSDNDWTKSDSVWLGSDIGRNLFPETDPNDNTRYLNLKYGETPNTSILLGTNFIRFKSGLKLYIMAGEPSPLEPDDNPDHWNRVGPIPDNSIGIGW